MNKNRDKTEFWPSVVQVVPADDFGIYVYFNDGSVRFFDVKPLIKPNTVFEPLSNIDYFKSKLTIINDTVAWDVGGNRDPRKCIDLDPFVLFKQPAITDPLHDTLLVAEDTIPYSHE
ncbi:MAG: DUF2442 domain-containing protein [Oscillospiraceae bacterium]|nr:DUF2442 domain-containing protein [Oscillospiraceae bacterium]